MSCQQCGKKFTHINSLIRHRMIGCHLDASQPNQHNVCSECGFDFGLRCSILKRMKHRCIINEPNLPPSQEYERRAEPPVSPPVSPPPRVEAPELLVEAPELLVEAPELLVEAPVLPTPSVSPILEVVKPKVKRAYYKRKVTVSPLCSVEDGGQAPRKPPREKVEAPVVEAPIVEAPIVEAIGLL